MHRAVDASAWRPPRPQISFVVECRGDELPPMAAVVGPGAVEGAALDADEETMSGLDEPMTPGSRYWVTSPTGDLFLVEAGARGVTVSLDALAGLPSVAVDYATRVAARVRDLTGGAVDLEPFAIEVSAERDGLWLRTQGLVRFGRPELEAYGIAADDAAAAEAAMRRLAAFVSGGGTIEPGRVLGVGSAWLVAREGERNRERWGDAVVLELVDVDASGELRETGSSLGRREWLLR